MEPEGPGVDLGDPGVEPGGPGVEPGGPGVDPADPGVDPSRRPGQIHRSLREGAQFHQTQVWTLSALGLELQVC